MLHPKNKNLICVKATGYPSTQPFLSCRNPVALTSCLSIGRIPQWLSIQILEIATWIQTPTLTLPALKTLDKSLEVSTLVYLPSKRQKWEGKKTCLIALLKWLNSGIYAKLSKTVPGSYYELCCVHIAYPYPRCPEHLSLKGVF